VARSELETAYFALLRAREELAALQRYEEVLRAEAQRLRRSRSEGEALIEQVDPRLLRAIRHTDAALEKAVEARLAVVEDERVRLPARIEAAAEHVDERERAHTALRDAG
jgi:tRNA G26 N,N-dimethylase Trm1